MSEVLKQVEEALEQMPKLAQRWVSAAVEAYDSFGNTEEWARMNSRGDDFQACCDSALTSLRGLEWRPIAEMERLETYEVVCGAYSITGEWVMTRFQTAKAAIGLGYTHFCRPILPTPPKREVENAG